MWEAPPRDTIKYFLTLRSPAAVVIPPPPSARSALKRNALPWPPEVQSGIPQPDFAESSLGFISWKKGDKSGYAPYRSHTCERTGRHLGPASI